MSYAIEIIKLIQNILLYIILPPSTLALFYLVQRILRPYIIKHPWPQVDKSLPSFREDKAQKVIIAGSFNPPHCGHLELVNYLSERYGNVIVVVGVNPYKTYTLTASMRGKLLNDMLKSSAVLQKNGNVRVEVVSGYIWRFAMKEKVSILFRGIRTWKKDGFDETFLNIQNTYGPIWYGPLKFPLPTYYLEGKPQYNHISSSLIRDIIVGGWNECGEDDVEKKKEAVKNQLSGLIPDEISDLIIGAYVGG